MQGKRVELKKFLKNMEIQNRLDKLKHRNRSRKWSVPQPGRKSDARYLSRFYIH